MKQWSINIEEIQKILNKEYSENTYLIEPRGSKDIEIFVNEMIDKDLSICPKEILHIFKVDNYLIWVFTSAKGKELKQQLKSIFFAVFFVTEKHCSDIKEKMFLGTMFVDFYKQVENAKHI